MMVNIVVPKVYRLKTIPPEPHQRIGCPDLTVGMLLWCYGNRRTCILSGGEYVGTFSPAWQSNGFIGGTGRKFQMLMEYVEPVL